VEDVDLTAGRRLQLAAETRGATAFVLKRRPFGGRTKRPQGSTAATRWRVASAPSEPPVGEFGLGAPRFRVALERCRGGRTGAFLFEAAGAYAQQNFAETTDGAHPLRLVADLGDRGLAPAQPLAA
jgi:protein ImuA